MKISIIGSGLVGTVIGRGLNELGNEVIVHDIVNRDLPNFTKDVDYAVENSIVPFVCVPTPTNDNGEIDLSYVKKASKNIGTVGRYIFTSEIFDCIKKTPPGEGNEIPLTDAIRMLIKEEKKDVYAYKFRGKRYDAGDKLGYMKAIIDFALKKEDLKEEIKRYLREIGAGGET
jgi:UDP-glucose 6-dehydrogenase